MSGIGPMLVAVDDGYDYIKVWTRERSDRIPTAVSLTTRTMANLLDRRDARERVYAIRSGQACVGSETIDVSTEVARQKRVLIETISQFMQARFGNNAPLIKRVLFVGGGSSALEPELRRMFPSAVFARDPQMANARGMFKYGTVAGASDPKARFA